tara:strand:- start:152 stop:490 length:339 start_codon:yes stop_codon:yes gene_type:complete
MTNQQLIPTQELLNQWCYASTGDWREIAAIAARWGYKQGADEELEACCEWVSPFSHDDCHYEDKLRAARRPKPLSLKEEALSLLDEFSDPEGLYLDVKSHNTIRRALEQLDD